MSTPLLSVRIAREQDVVKARRLAKEVAAAVGFETQDQIRLATAVSEICRNAYSYGGGGRLDFSLDGPSSARVLAIRVVDWGPGIASLDAIMQGRYQSPTGMGVGLMGARRLVDDFKIDTSSGRGTSIQMRKSLPRLAPALTADSIAKLSATLSRPDAALVEEELTEQNHELMRAMDELRARQEELSRLNRELEDTNRGVVALYAELDEKAEDLRRANELKSTFLSHMSHEFRTPLNSILALTRILLQRLDGPLAPEQEKQVSYIQKAAQELTDMVNDLLDLAKMEAGKIEVHAAEFQISGLFGMLRGMLRPLLYQQPVQLHFDLDQDFLLYSDEGKISQILRNFISNAIKFTDDGEIRVQARRETDGIIRLSVSDTGIGIAPEDQERIFKQFEQVDGRKQRRVKGTGLGLPLSARLAELLGGKVELQSKPGEGSTFSVLIPQTFRGQTSSGSRRSRESTTPPAAEPEAIVIDTPVELLVIDDDDTVQYLIKRQFEDLPVQVTGFRDPVDGLKYAQTHVPTLVLLDLMMPSMNGYEALDELRSMPQTSTLPVIIHTSKPLSAGEMGEFTGRVHAVVGKGPESSGEVRRLVISFIEQRGAS